MKRLFLAIFIIILALILVGGGSAMYNMRDRHRGYELNLQLPLETAAQSTAPFRVGLAKVPITPNVEDTWTDSNNNARYEPDKGETFEDRNGNGKFDAYWLAGFQNSRPATGVHDDLWARAIYFDDGVTRVAYVAIDAIGMFHDGVVEVRKMAEEQDLGLDHIIVSSTHNHETPDLMGLWGPKFYKSGVNTEYMAFVQEQIVESIRRAKESARPGIIRLSKIDSTAHDLVRDSRPPRVLDDAVHMMHFMDAEADTTLGILLNWGNHPETLADDNLEITSDFAHYWLKAVESGIEYDGEIKEPGIGGIAVWANGAVGGLMTSLGCDIYDPWRGKSFKAASFEKARAQGNRLAKLVLDQVKKGSWDTVESPKLRLVAKTFPLAVDNKYFKLGGALGIFHRGFYKIMKMRSEMNLLAINNDAWLLTIPGEINPEIVNGGIELPDGADFPEEIVESPPIRELMKAKYNFVIGLGNDEVGYIMPKSHWDVKPPFTYGAKKPMYAEVNSLGPNTGPAIYAIAKELVEAF